MIFDIAPFLPSDFDLVRPVCSNWPVKLKPQYAQSNGKWNNNNTYCIRSYLSISTDTNSFRNIRTLTHIVWCMLYAYGANMFLVSRRINAALRLTNWHQFKMYVMCEERQSIYLKQQSELYIIWLPKQYISERWTVNSKQCTVFDLSLS